jgi:hypothetical protein
MYVFINRPRSKFIAVSEMLQAIYIIFILTDTSILQHWNLTQQIQRQFYL